MTDKPANVYQKLNEARSRLHAMELKKSGKLRNGSYFELADFLLPALAIFKDIGLCEIISFSTETARMEIINTDNPAERIAIESPMGSASLSGCHEVQNIGAVETYQRRYLWFAAMEIVEHDALDASIAKGETPADKTKPDPVKPEKVMQGLPTGPITDATREWLEKQLAANNVTSGALLTEYNLSDLNEFTYADIKEVQVWIEKQKEKANA
jgi:hypothetical protein